jgi:hypothetical protein
VVFRIEDIDNAINALLESGVKILSASEVYSI